MNRNVILKDLLWILIILIFAGTLIYNPSREQFKNLTTLYPYGMGFIKTAVLATMGELLAFRIKAGHYKLNMTTVYKFVVWGFLGMCFVIVFKIFDGGISSAESANLLPQGSKFLHAFLTSTFMNLIFAPTFMALHRVTDTFIELRKGRLGSIIKVKVDTVIDEIDWHHFIKFVILKTIPFFWIPAHTITFLLPSEYRVLMAASLSIALGLILSIKKRKN